MTQPAVPSSHTIDLNHELTEGFAARFIRRKSRQMLEHTGLRESDRPDVEQYLLLAVWKAATSFDPAAGDWEAFVATVVERRADRFLKRRRADKRLNGQELASLDVLVKDQDGVDVPLATQIGAQHREGVTGRFAATDAELFETEHDVNVMLDSAAPRTRQLCSELLHQSERDVAEQHGVARRTVRKHMRRLRDRFDD